ncbi:hypothetical protein BJ508DRAFT_327628 [Ascobolus immersus RN42]|uniref:Uncharacterized protein n=1 Tax=Ascobolus immersus RN42 TaxID=1160509 RepID=A0A3N4I205_ASCIM|nr:hypothetical protein BJ508DRAFT_327628 [Ascobolus immersus RN42]
MHSPQRSPTYDYPSRQYPYPHVDLSKAHITPSCLPPAPPPTASTPSATVGEYFFPFPVNSPQHDGHPGYMTSPRTRHSISGAAGAQSQQQPPSPAGFPAMPRRSSFNYVHDLQEFRSHHKPTPKDASDSEDTTESGRLDIPEDSTTPPASPGKHRPRRLSLKDYLPLGRLPLQRPESEGEESAIEEEPAEAPAPAPKPQQHSQLTPPESPTNYRKEHHIPHRHHHRHHTITVPGLDTRHKAAGMTSHNCFNSEDMKHLQHVHLLVHEAVDAFVVAGEDRRRRRDSFGGTGHSFTATPARVGRV